MFTWRRLAWAGRMQRQHILKRNEYYYNSNLEVGKKTIVSNSPIGKMQACIYGIKVAMQNIYNFIAL